MGNTLMGDLQVSWSSGAPAVPWHCVALLGRGRLSFLRIYFSAGGCSVICVLM